MPFSYVTGTPTNVVAGSTASMNDVQGPFTDLKAFINSGVGDAYLASAPNAVWRTVWTAPGCIQMSGGASFSTTKNVFEVSNGTNVASGTSVGSAYHGVWTPPSASDEAVNLLTTRY